MTKYQDIEMVGIAFVNLSSMVHVVAGFGYLFTFFVLIQSQVFRVLCAKSDCKVPKAGSE